MSHLTWVRGLKQLLQMYSRCQKSVAPYVGAWVETERYVRSRWLSSVAPYVGAWVETLRTSFKVLALKVAPYVGAWVETKKFGTTIKSLLCRTLRGCVG